MPLPMPLQELVERYNSLVDQFNAGHITQDDALSTLASTHATDATGATWTMAPSGQFTRTTYPGAPGEPADPSQFVDAGTILAPTPAFPAPATFGDLDTPPTTSHADTWGAATGPAALPVDVANEPTNKHRPPRALREPREPRTGILGSLSSYYGRNRPFVTIVTAGVLIVVAAVMVPRLTSTDSSTTLPHSTPGAVMPVDAPAATGTTPSSVDALAVITALESGDPAKVQAMIATPMDPATTLRTQAMWKGLAGSAVTVTPQPAAQSAPKTAAQVWTLTRDGQPAPVTTITVNWTSDGTRWKLTTAPTF